MNTEDTIGLARGNVRLVQYNKDWAVRFDAEAALISKKLGMDIAEVRHVGSTAIPGIMAKPIIDIAIAVDSLQQADDWATALAEIGYWDKGPQQDMPNRRFFAKGPEEKRTVYLHIVLPDEYKRLIDFRDTLRANAKLAGEYSRLKQNLASTNSDNRAAYTKQKSDFIEGVLHSLDSLDLDANKWLSKLLGSPFKATKHMYSHQDEVYRIETQSDAYYLKISRSLKAERDNLKKLDGILSVPRVVDFYDANEKDYLLISELPGKNLVELIGVLPETEIVEKFADAIRQLHNLDATKVFAGAKPDDVLLHGDMALPNIIISDDGNTSYIDFGQLSFGTPELDLADAIWSLQRNLGPAYGELFLKSYGPLAMTPKIEEALKYRHDN